MNQEELVNKSSEIKNISREIEGYKVQVRSFDITRKINFFLTAACVFGVFYDESVNQWWLNQYIIAGFLFGLISIFSHRKWEKTSKLMTERESHINYLKSKIDQSEEDGD